MMVKVIIVVALMVILRVVVILVIVVAGREDLDTLSSEARMFFSGNSQHTVDKIIVLMSVQYYLLFMFFSNLRRIFILKIRLTSILSLEGVSVCSLIFFFVFPFGVGL